MPEQDALTHPPAFSLYMWPHRALYFGVSPENALHRHRAAQLCIGLEDAVTVRGANDGASQRDHAILIPPECPHEVAAGPGRLLALYWEPESTDYPFAAFKSEVQPYPIATHSLRTLTELDVNACGPEEVWARCEAALKISIRPNVPIDQRVVRTVAHIRSSPGTTHTLDSLAARVHLSPSRLRHVFKEHMGVNLRRFIVWTRSRQVVQEALCGSSLTQAAYAAGFSDTAHMSRTFRGLFGFSPSVLFAAQVPKRVYLMDTPE